VDREEAIAIAQRCPAAQWCTVEVRPLAPCFDESHAWHGAPPPRFAQPPPGGGTGRLSWACRRAARRCPGLQRFGRLAAPAVWTADAGFPL